MKILDLNQVSGTLHKFISGLNRQKFDQMLRLTILGSIIFIIIALFITNKMSNNYIDEINILHNQIQQTENFLANYAQTIKYKNNLEDILSKEKNFEIKSFFENFCRENQLRPEQNWSVSSNAIPGNDIFEEVTLDATFRGLNSAKLVSILESIEQKEIVYVRELKINKDRNKTISFDITLATFRHKGNE